MTRLIAIAGLTGCLMAPAGAAEMPKAAKAGNTVSVDQAKQDSSMRKSFESWLRDLRARVARTRAHQNQLIAVAAVRGDEQPDSPPLYWKGRKGRGAVAPAELDAFEKAVDAAMSNAPDAKSQLQSFLSTYPKSAMADDAKTALDKLDAVSAPQ
ncbi:MAG: hypothetical protein JO102_01235 [Elusimicrobia bacterium]|nr:hypothetical protein [Elusimicrobiota bacterium]